MTNSDFLKNDNIEMLWDVIIDENIFKNKSPQIQNEIKNTFLNNIQGFYKIEQLNTKNLISLNKKYILMILNHITKTFSSQQQPTNRIKIYDDTVTDKKELITFEDIQNDRTTQFERDLNKYKEDFNNDMSLPVPPVPVFADNSKDLPISEMEKMIKEITDKRNYDIEQINRNISVNNTDNNADTWLKPKETSIKSEKYQQTPQNPKEDNKNNSVLKHIKIEQTELDKNVYKNQIIDLHSVHLHESLKKSVTWGANEMVELAQEQSVVDMDSDLFKKLKLKRGVPVEKQSPIANIESETKEDVTEEINVMKKEIRQINNMVEVLDNNIKTILEILKNKQF
jgi:hypothetical protein